MLVYIVSFAKWHYTEPGGQQATIWSDPNFKRKLRL